MYSRKTGRELVQVPGIVQHGEHPIVIGTPNRLVVGERRGVELKSENVFVDQFGDPGTDQVPEYYAVQCAQYMAITDFDAWDVGLLHGGSKFSIYTLERDRATEDALIELLVAWWHRHVVADVAPELDGSESARRYVLEKFPKDRLAMREATTDEVELAIKLGDLRAQFIAIENAKKEIENILRDKIGNHAGIFGSFGKITHKRTKDGTEIDFEAAYLDVMREIASLFRMLPEEQMLQAQEIAIRKFEEVRARHTHPRDGYRRLLNKPAKG